MTRLSLTHLPCVLCMLACCPALQASERGAQAPASAYRLSNVSDGASANGSPYQLDLRFRLAPEVDETLPDKPYARQIDEAAREAGVDPALVHAVISVESAYRWSAVSPKGAVGLMQVLPETALRYGVRDPSGVSDNLRAGTRYLHSLMERYDDRLELVLAAYNAGEGAVKRYNNTIPPYAETRHYVPAVIARYQAAGKRPATGKSAKPVVHEYLAGTRLETMALSRFY